MDEQQVPVGSWDSDGAAGPSTSDGDMALYDLRVVVDRIEGRSVCSMQVGDSFDLTESSRLRIPGAFCLYALQAVLPLLPAKQRPLPAHDWLERDAYVACPDPDERLIMRIERGPLRSMNSQDLT
ncbi:TIGR04076 family protein [Nakamurella flava]|uniref:TIGR04076 family protein n=1 Tax=Nakamurella flava TaxID=2576308 RepID=A0A4U6QE85_9ACTN|nr:TIGR04076 family protein [Nakamurella flava]TKV58524.1 TIGR04076 family protein [Nakamurella flava]